MPDFGPHAWFIIGALATFALVIGGLIAETLATAIRTRRALRRFEHEKR
jgi:hypothetical protein